VNGKKAKALRRKVTGDPDLQGKLFRHRRVIACDIETHQEIVDPRVSKSIFHHLNSFKAQYKQAKKEAKRRCKPIFKITNLPHLEGNSPGKKFALSTQIYEELAET
jgi:hypothetical protein